MRTISRTVRFRKDYKREARGQYRKTLDADLLAAVSLIAGDGVLPEKFHDHPLTAEWKDHRDCHIRPDLVLIYRVPDMDTLELVRLGSHSELEPLAAALAKLIQTPMNPWPIAIGLAYLLGSIPFGYLLVGFVMHQDIRTVGSGNIGATNVLRGGNKSLGIATLLLDLGKAFLSVILARHLAPGNYDLAVAAGFAAVVGHCFPVWLRFRGGKGVASGLGAFLALSWPTALCGAAVFLLVVLLTRFVSLASVLAAAALPLFAFYFVPQRTPIAVAGLLLIPLLVIVKHHANIRRLLAGTESRFGSRKAAA